MFLSNFSCSMVKKCLIESFNFCPSLSCFTMSILLKSLSKEQLNLFIDNMNQDQAWYCLKEAILSCHNRGVFTLEESEAVSKSLRLLLT